MKFNSQLSVKKERSNLFFLSISLILAFLLAFPLTLLIFEVGPFNPVKNDPIYRGFPSPIDPDSIIIPSVVLFLIVFLIIIASTFIIFTFFKMGSQFAFNRILKNENRKKITHQIFLYPGIHYNELLRVTELQPGQLQWHLNILLDNKIIRKDKIEHFVVYFPTNMQIPVNNDYLFLKKSKLTFTILNHIKQNSGIYQSKIAHDLNLKRNTVKYHIDKLLQKKFISSAHIGRKKLLYSSTTDKI